MEPQRKRLLYRCQHCGMKENDVLLGRFVQRHIADFSEAQLDLLDALLEAGDNDIYDWITGREPVPAAHDHELMAWLKEFNGVDTKDR